MDVDVALMRFPFDGRIDCLPDEDAYAMRVGREVYRRLTDAEICALNEGSPEAQARFDKIKTEIERQYPFHEQIANTPCLPRGPGRGKRP